MGSFSEAIYQEEAYHDAALRLHDELLHGSTPAVTDSANYPFGGQDLWDTYFVRSALACLNAPRRRVLLHARPNAPLRTLLGKMGLEVVDQPPTGPNRLQRMLPKSLGSLAGVRGLNARTARVRPDDTVVIDSLINEVPDPIAVLHDFAGQLDETGAVIAVARMAPGAGHDHFKELGFVIPPTSALKTFHQAGFRVEVVPKTRLENDNDAWPPFKLMGLLIRRSL